MLRCQKLYIFFVDILDELREYPSITGLHTQFIGRRYIENFRLHSILLHIKLKS